MHERIQVRNDSATQIIARLQNEGYSCIPFGNELVFDKTTFWAAVRQALPSDPAFGSKPSWDGFADSLFGGIDRLASTKIAIVWMVAHRMARASPDEFSMAVDCFTSVASQLADLGTGVSCQNELIVVLLGEIATIQSALRKR